jgi:myo-inositol 2-dehydrogenase/D-chiro-inositol 1-dehydrogenase
VRVEVVGDEGSVLIGNPVSRPGVTLMRRADGADFPQDYRELFAAAYVAELTAFVAACRGVGPRGPSLEDDRRAVEIGVAARASAVAGRPLEVGPDWLWP